MSDLDEKGLEAAHDAYEKANPYDIFYPAVDVAIRAYEAHRKPLEHRGDCTQEAFTCQLCNAYNEGYDDAMAHKASAVPEEIAEVVKDLRDVAENLKVPVPKNAEGYVYYAEAMVALRAADLLEGYARLGGDCTLPKRAEHMAKMADMVHEQALSEAAYVARKASVCDAPPYCAPAQKASAVPEEIAEVVRQLRIGYGQVDWASVMERAADLLEGYARQAAPADADKQA